MKAFAYQRYEPWVQEQLCLLRPHRHDRQPLMGAVVCRQFRAPDQRSGLHQAVHVDWKHLHGVWQDQLWVGTLHLLSSNLLKPAAELGAVVPLTWLAADGLAQFLR